ncbi:MAG: hypothetical protein IPK80_20220 [Nannocystis sp.]|nr:hypothetical protein [Nannocystis sp.]
MPRPLALLWQCALLGGLVVADAEAAPATSPAASVETKPGAAERSKEKEAKKGRRRGALLGQVDEDPAGGQERELPRDPLALLGVRLDEVEAAIIEAERIAAASTTASDAEGAKRLVAGQLLLEEGDPERAVVLFLALVEGGPDTPAGIQARHFLGEALARLEMSTWAVECFLANLADERPDARRYHQASLGRLLDLAAPRRELGFARRPGLSALPELRGRLRALGLATTTPPPRGVLDPPVVGRVRAQIAAIPPEQRAPELRYALGRYLYFTGENSEAIAELDSLSPTDIPLSRGGAGAGLRVRAAYVAAVAVLASGEVEDAMDRFARVVKATPTAPSDRQIVELAWLARARINHDRGEYERALQAYRRIGRASAFYFTAVYETAWTLLRAERFAQAAEALDRLLELEPAGPLTPELKQLRGKLRIKQGALEVAEAEFEALRLEFERRGQTLAALDVTPAYFAAVASGDPGFQLGAALPRSLVPIARTLPRAVQAESLAQLVGELDHELADLRALLARMEEAVNARDRARVFVDLGAQVASLDRSSDDLIEVLEGLVTRGGRSIEPRALAPLEERRRALRGRVDDPEGAGSGADALSRDPRRRLSGSVDLQEALTAAIGELKAELLGLEQGLLGAAGRRIQVDTRAAAEGVIELRGALRELEAQARRLREQSGRLEVSLRYDDPTRRARSQAVAVYRGYLDALLAAFFKAKADPEASRLWERGRGLATRIEGARERLDAAALARLQATIGVLREERVNLDRYREQLEERRVAASEVVGEVLYASVRDVAAEVDNWMMRSEVGKLDVAWAQKEAEGERARDLERRRDRDLRELDRALDAAKEAAR